MYISIPVSAFFCAGCCASLSSEYITQLATLPPLIRFFHKPLPKQCLCHIFKCFVLAVEQVYFVVK